MIHYNVATASTSKRSEEQVMRRKGNPAFVGAFVVVAAAVLFGFMIFTGGFDALRRENERFILIFEENLYGLKKGSRVTLSGVQVGRVERFYLGQSGVKAPVPVLVEIDRKMVSQHMVNDPGGLFDEEGRFNPEMVPRIRGRLETESYVTGILYVNLEYDAELPPHKSSETHKYPEIATRVSGLKEFTDSLDPQHLGRQINKLLATANTRLDELDVAVISDSFRDIAGDFGRFIDTFTERFAPLGPNIASTSDEARATLEELRELAIVLRATFSPSSDFRFEIGDTLRQVSSTMKSLRQLADFLERNPQAILRGKGGPGGKDR